MKSKSQCFSFIVALSLPLMLTACGAAPEDSALKIKVQELESENATLKTEIAILKDSFAKAKTQELTAAFKGVNLQADSTQKGSSTDATVTAGAVGTGPSAASSNTGSAISSSGGFKSLPNTSSTAVASVPAQDNTPKFIDLEETPTKEMIEDLAKLHVFDGVGDKFNPNKPITRAEYAEWLFKSYNAMEPSSKQLRFAPQVAQQFKDTPESVPQYKYIQALANAGFSIGYEDGTFRPKKEMTREEMLGIKIGIDVGKTLPPWRAQMDSVWKFSDGKAVDEKFTGYVHQDFYVSGPHGSNIQRAFGKIGTFRPKQPVLRYEAAATLWQMGQFGDTQNTNAAVALKEKDLHA